MTEITRAFLEGLRSALQCHAARAHAPLVPLAGRGLAHWHVRLLGTRALARIPKQSQLGLAPDDNLRHQQACFERAGPSGHTPLLLGVLAAGEGLPRGALVVEEIAGAALSFPSELRAVAAALAALHALPLPPRSERPPLADAADPLQDMLAEVLRQAEHLPQARLAREARELVEGELRALQALVRRPDWPPRALIALDAHPGNFLRRPDGQAVLVDLEKCRYSYPGLDLAHTTLYTSTTWDAASSAALSVREVADFYGAWEAGVGPAMAAAARPWHAALRQAMWLWSLTWCCKWRALAHLPPQSAQGGEDWSAANNDPALVEHVRERVGHYLSPAVIVQVRQELRELQRMMNS